MSDVEDIISAIENADEVEIMEFNFNPCFNKLRSLEQELEAAKAEIKSNISELKKTYELISYWADDSRNKELEIKALRSQPTPREVINSALGYLDSCLYGDEGFNEIVAALKYHRDNRLGDNIETMDK